MWNDPNETIVGGGGEAYVAPVGTALPAKTGDALNVAFNGLGYHTEDGVSINPSVDIQEFMAWQSKVPIRIDQNSRDFQISFQLLQWNEINLPFALGGGTISEPTAGQFKFVPLADSAAPEERSLIVDIDDGTRRSRIIVPRGTVTDTGEIPFKRGDMSALAVTFKALAPTDGSGSSPWYALFNDSAAFAAGS